MKRFVVGLGALIALACACGGGGGDRACDASTLGAYRCAIVELPDGSWRLDLQVCTVLSAGVPPELLYVWLGQCEVGQTCRLDPPGCH